MERREILQGGRFTVVQAKQIFTSIRSMDYFPPSPSLGNFEWMANERKKEREEEGKRKKKVGDVQWLNHSDRRVIAAAEGEINRDLIARIFGFTAIPRVTRFQTFLDRPSLSLASGRDTLRLAPALSVSNSTCRGTIRAEHDGQPDFPDEFRRRR